MKNTVPTYAASAQPHRIILGMSAFVLVVSALLSIAEDGRIKAPLVDATLPGTCMTKNWFHIDCPGCGLTRCFVSMAHGDYSDAWGLHPMGTILFAAAVWQLPWQGAQLMRIAMGRRPLIWTGQVGLAWLFLAAFVVQWVVRMWTTGLFH